MPQLWEEIKIKKVAIISLIFLSLSLLLLGSAVEPIFFEDQNITLTNDLTYTRGYDIIYLNCTVRGVDKQIKSYSPLSFINCTLVNTTIISLRDLTILNSNISHGGDTAVFVYRSDRTTIRGSFFKGGGVMVSITNYLDFINNTMNGNGIKPNIRVYRSNKITIENNTLKYGRDNAVRVGGSRDVSIKNNTIDKAHHESILFTRSADVTIELNKILNGDVGIEAYENSKNFTIVRNYVEVGRTPWGVAFEAENAHGGEWRDNTAVLMDPASMSWAVKLEWNCTDLDFFNNTFKGFNKGFKSTPKNSRTPLIGSSNVYLYNSTFPNGYIVNSYNLNFSMCNFNETDFTVIDSENIYFEAVPREPAPITYLYRIISNYEIEAGQYSLMMNGSIIEVYIEEDS